MNEVEDFREIAAKLRWKHDDKAEASMTHPPRIEREIPRDMLRASLGAVP
jgi:hypothetical protein